MRRGWRLHRGVDFDDIRLSPLDGYLYHSANAHLWQHGDWMHTRRQGCQCLRRHCPASNNCGQAYSGPRLRRLHPSSTGSDLAPDDANLHDAAEHGDSRASSHRPRGHRRRHHHVYQASGDESLPHLRVRDQLAAADRDRRCCRSRPSVRHGWWHAAGSPGSRRLVTGGR